MGGVDSDEYLAAFMSGFEFVLLAFEGRLAAGELDGAAEARVQAFVRDYERILAGYRERHGADAPVPASMLALVALGQPRHN